MQKNVAGQKWIVYAWNITTHAPVTGDAANITANLRLDGGGADATDDVNPTELEDGYYIFDISRAESNADLILISPASSTGSVQVDGVPKSVWTNQNIALADRNAALTESNRGSHTWSGNMFYVDPVNGNTHASGNRGGRNDPYLTIQDCHDNAVVDSNHDVIILVAGAAGGVTTHTVAATTTISKRYTFIRGPGRDFIWTRTGAGDTIAITADGVEISGVQIGTAASGAGDGIDITDADFIRIHNCWFLDTRGDGIHVLRGSNCRFHNNHFEGTGVSGSGQGIHIVGTAGSSDDNAIYDNHFADTAGDSVLIEQGTTNDTNIQNNVIHNSSGWAVNIGASSTDAQVHSNTFGNNASGNITDSGTTTIQTNNEQWAKHSIATEARLVELDAANIPTDIANVPGLTWDEVISTAAHNIVQSAGKRLRQATATVVANDTAEVSNSPGINQIQLASGESSTDGTFDPGIVGIVAGTGIGQSRLILEYAGVTRIATLNRDWKVAPDGTSEYIVMAAAGGLHVNEGLATGGTPSTITLNALASSTNNVYIDQIIFLVSGTGQDQVGRVTAYNGITKVATMAQTWDTTPDTTTAYIMVPDAPALFQGYEGAAIWIDTINGSAGTISYENGTAENPVNSLADAITLATNLGFSQFMIMPGSSITLAQSYDGFVFGGVGVNGWILALGGQSISSTTIIGATVSGICTGANAPSFLDCSIGVVTIPASRLISCALTSSIVCSAIGVYIFDQCCSAVAGTGSPDIDFGAAVGNTQLNFRHYSGGIEIKNMGATGTDTMSLEGNGQLVINANCVGGTVAIRGHFTITDNAGGVLTLSDDARFDTAQLLTTQMTEAYAADGVAPTLAQALFLIQQTIGDFSVSGTTLTAKKLDSSTTAATYTLDDASNPTSRTRAT